MQARNVIHDIHFCKFLTFISLLLLLTDRVLLLIYECMGFGSPTLTIMRRPLSLIAYFLSYIIMLFNG